MNVIENFVFFKDAESAGESKSFVSHCYTEGTIEVRGDATSFSVEVQGCLNREGEIQWTTLCVIDERNLALVTDITEKSLYSFYAMGKGIRVKINNISGGKLTVVGKFLN